MQKNPMQGPHKKTHVGRQEEKQRRKGRGRRKERVDSASEMNEVEGKHSRQMKGCPDKVAKGEW